MKHDVTNRKDIENLVNTFYEKVKLDTHIGYFFLDIVNVNWEKHLPIMYDFWENVLFYSGNYSGNPMDVHIKLNEIAPIKIEHFQRWLEIFNETVDELFEGETSFRLKQRASSIATVMQIKILN
ncbi:MAG: group III truncated hemoglobin [Chlorobiota bacterium]|jgi:hemoglobin|nr:group III truncated hemoglobin [Chlorobiota bacterium]QQS67598.1 MAG: group III truncated hemoglobin [Chlorobiota bacterium]